MAQFAQQTPDENLSPGWTVQGTGSAQSTTGIPGAGFAQSAVVPAGTVVGQTSAGFPNPPGAGNIGSENSAAYTSQILVNGSYSVSPTTSLSQLLTAPTVPASTVAVQSPTGLNATVSTTGGTVTAISVAPWNAGGSAAATFTQVATSSPAAFSVPPAGYVKMTYSSAPTWVWTPTN
jgi:hypothetical protein